MVVLSVIGASGCSLVTSSIFAPCHKLVVPSDAATNFVPRRDRGTAAGASKVDITPPPGFPTGGDGMAGGLSRGYWTRLYSRAFFFEEGGRHLLLVSNDLYQIPEALHAEVAGRLADEGIRPDEIILTATHTHQGPGNFGSAAVYNEFGSQYMGFSRELFDFLASRIADAGTAAIKDARAHRSPVELVVRRGQGPDVFLNRAPQSFLLNTNRDALMDEWNPNLPGDAVSCCESRRPKDPPDGWSIEGCPRLRAIDRTITLLEVHRGGERIAGLLFFAMHPTILHHQAALNSSDFPGEVVGTLERRWANGTQPVVGFFNGAEGDIVARRGARDVGDIADVSTALLQTIEGGLAADPPEPLRLEVRHEDISAAGNCCTEEPDGHAWRLGSVPEYGVAGLGGGEGDRTILYSLGWREGMVGPAENGQDLKVPGLDSTVVRELRLSSMLAPPWKFPSHLPLSYGRLGPIRFVAVPVELTTLAGWQVRQAASESGDPRSVVILGLANGYSSYVATREEYLAQDYIGASTIWGPQEADFIACKAAELKNSDKPLPEQVRKHVFSVGELPERKFGPTFLGQVRQDPLEANLELFLDATHRPARGLPAFSWCEHPRNRNANEGHDPDFPITAERKLRISEQVAGEWRPRVAPDDAPPGDVGADDDSGFNLVTMLMDGSRPHTRRWTAVWVRPTRGPIDGTFRFEVTGSVPGTCVSKSFTCTQGDCQPLWDECDQSCETDTTAQCADSDGSRTPIPIEAEHWFRRKPNTRSD